MPQDVAHITREHVEAFITSLLERWKPATANNRFRGLQAFFKWLLEEGEIRTNPTARVKPPRLPEYTPAVLTEKELRALLATCEKVSGFEDRRDHAILRVFIDTGARRAEIGGLRDIGAPASGFHQLAYGDSFDRTKRIFRLKGAETMVSASTKSWASARVELPGDVFGRMYVSLAELRHSKSRHAPGVVGKMEGRRVGSAGRLGFIVNTETRKRQPAKLVPGIALPEESSALPKPEDLYRQAPVNAPGSSANVQTAGEARTWSQSTKAFASPLQTAMQSVFGGDVDTGAAAQQLAFAGLRGANGDGSIMTCSHRPASEADRNWADAEARPDLWGSLAADCVCCGGPARRDLYDYERGLCPTCSSVLSAPPKGGHVVRLALDKGGQLLATGAD